MKTYEDLLVNDYDAVDEVEDILAPFEALWNKQRKEVNKK